MGDRRGNGVMYSERWVILTNTMCMLVNLKAKDCDTMDMLMVYLRKALL
jgi:hypothetical protein